MKATIKKTFFICIFTMLFLVLLMNKSNAAVEYSELNNKAFYIKNAYTGSYLDVDGGTAQPGTNVHQYEYNGSDAQKWYIFHLGYGEYMLYTFVGSTITDGTRYVKYALDVDNAINENGTQIHIWDAVKDGLTQTFSFTKTADSTYIIKTRCSYYEKVVSLSDNLCNNGINIHQWEYSNHSHDQWILEPIEKNTDMGISYARANYNTYIDAYPNVHNLGGDCTNFVSQCLLAGGQLHQDSTWYIKRLNTNYHTISTTSQLNNSWELSDPSPWISAKKFQSYFRNRQIASYTGSNIINNIDEVWGLNVFNGDVIQLADTIFGILIGDAFHTTYITGSSERYVNGETWPCYTVTYHSSNKKDRNLIDLVSDPLNDGSNYLEKLVIFYNFHNTN